MRWWSDMRGWFGSWRSPAEPLALAAPSAPAKASAPTEPAAQPQPRFGRRRPFAARTLSTAPTPARIAALLREAQEGLPGRFAQLVHEIEGKDLHIGSELAKRRRAVTGLRWHIEPASSGARDRRVARDIEARIRQIRGLNRALGNLLDATSKGYAVVEADWVVDATGARVRSLDYRPQWWFRPDPQDVTRWRVLDDSASEGIVPPAWRLIVHESGLVCGWGWASGLGQGLVLYWLFKHYALLDWNSYGEIFGSPLRVGHYRAGETKSDDIDLLEEALEQLGVDAWAAIPDDMKVEFVSAGGTVGPDVYSRMVEMCDRQISTGILGQTLTTTEGRGGSRALGEVHNDVRRDLLLSDAEELQETLTQQLVAPLTAFNFGADVPVPTWRFHTDPPEDAKLLGEVRESRLRVLKGALELGVSVPESQVREELGIRPASAGELELRRVAARTPRPRAGGCCTALVDRGSLPPHIAQVDELAERYAREGGAAAWKALVEAVQAALVGVASPGDVGARLLSLLEDLDLEALAQPLADATLTAELLGRLQVREGDLAYPLPRTAPIDAVDWWMAKRVVTRAEFDRLSEDHRKQAFTVASHAGLHGVLAFRDAIGKVLAEGGTLADLEDELVRVGQSVGSPVYLDLVFLNAVSQAQAVGRWREQTSSDALAERPWWRYHTVGDSRVRPAHENMDGRVWPADDAVWDVWYPPNGHKCRCWVTIHTEDEVRAAGWAVEADLPFDAAANAPLLPDAGWRRNPATPEPLDFSRYPAEWVKALGQEAA